VSKKQTSVARTICCERSELAANGRAAKQREPYKRSEFTSKQRAKRANFAETGVLLLGHARLSRTRLVPVPNPTELEPVLVRFPCV